MIASGKNPESGLVEIIELPNHPFFIGVQYHPELKSSVENPQPIFVHFIKAPKNLPVKKICGIGSGKGNDLRQVWKYGSMGEWKC